MCRMDPAASPSPSPGMSGGEPPLAVNQLTWAVLLGRWVQFARSAAALPDDRESQALRQSVPDVIMLQAVWFALQHLEELPADERALGLDRAKVLIDKHAAALETRWLGAAMPPPLGELIADARAQWQAVEPPT